MQWYFVEGRLCESTSKMRQKIQVIIVATYNMLNQLSCVDFGFWTLANLFGSWNPQFHLELDLSNVEPRLRFNVNVKTKPSPTPNRTKINISYQIGSTPPRDSDTESICSMQ